MEIEEILGKMDHGVAPGVAELLALGSMANPVEFAAAAGIVAALDRLTEAVRGISGLEERGDARSIAAGLVHAYDRWLAETPEPERIRDADMKLANVIRELRSLGGG